MILRLAFVKVHRTLGYLTCGLGFVNRPIFIILCLYEIVWSILVERFGSDAQTKIDNYIRNYKQSQHEPEISSKRVAIVTGATHGIGYETAKAIGRAGHHTILACRNKRLGIAVAAQLSREVGLDTFEVMVLDLASMSSINAFCDELIGRSLPLHVLVNNAGVSGGQYRTTSDGVEMHFGVNYLGHYIVTTRLLPVLRRSAPARIINVGSLAYYWARAIDQDVVLNKEQYDEAMCYAVSKLTSNIFVNFMAREVAGSGVTANSVHPGWVKTNVAAHLPDSRMRNAILVSSSKFGALTSIYLALSPEVEGINGKFFCYCSEMYTAPGSEDEEKQKELVEFTDELIRRASKRGE